MKYVSYAAIAAATLAFGIASAQAGSATGSLSVTAAVNSGCSVSSTGVAFGTVPDTYITAPNATGTISVNCTATTTPTNIGLGDGLYAGTGISGSPTPRTMAGSNNSNNKLGYDLFFETSSNPSWRSTNGGPSIYQSGAGQSYTVYGMITSGSGNYAADNYSDTVAITVSY